jgi:sulfate adenylyltransferase (ADP) / ATP adenylyltransferase
MTIEDGGVEFIVRRATQIKKKDAAATRDEGDPFATPEPELFVADLSPTHYALLNKYNVLDRHLLVITRAYAEQETPLEAADFEALACCLHGPPVLGFYNGGQVAGASQRHKHLQIVRLPLSPKRDLPIESLVASDAMALPLRHAFMRLPVKGSAADLHERYRHMLHEAGCEAGPYNLLVARDWMLLVPRSRATFEGIPVNSLAFAGALFVRDEDELRAVERIGPMAVLRGVAFPKESS